MLERIKNWIIKIWNKHKDNLEPEEYKLSHDKFAKLILTDILAMIPPLILSEYNTISVQFINFKENKFMIVSFCNVYTNDYNSEIQKERGNKEEYKWNLDIVIDKNNFGNSCQQLIAFRDILKSLTKEKPHYSQNEINKLMRKARELDKENIKKDVDNS